MADLAEEEGGWLSVEEMMGQIQKNDQFSSEQSTSQVLDLNVFNFSSLINIKNDCVDIICHLEFTSFFTFRKRRHLKHQYPVAKLTTQGKRYLQMKLSLRKAKKGIFISLLIWFLSQVLNDCSFTNVS